MLKRIIEIFNKRIKEDYFDKNDINDTQIVEAICEGVIDLVAEKLGDSLIKNDSVTFENDNVKIVCSKRKTDADTSVAASIEIKNK